MAARTIQQWGPEDFRPNSGTFGDPGVDGQSRAYLAIANAETFDTPSFIAPTPLTTPLTVLVTYRMTSATANAIKLRAALEAVSDGDSLDTDASSSFDSNNDSSADVTVPGTAGFIDQASITLTNNDSVAAGDICRLRLTRITPTGTEASGDLEVLAVELRDNGA